MNTAFSIDRNTGSIHLGNIAILGAAEPKATVEQQVASLFKYGREFGNGYEWLYLHKLTFGGRPAHLGLCFHDGLLDQVSWSVELLKAVTEGGWPTRETIEAEIAFVRRTLTHEMKIDCRVFSWGEVWSSFDAKGFLASNGLRYRLA